jgi:DNA-binding response OmpR family regulator
MPLQKTSVLVVDDDVYMLRIIQRILETEGYQVVTAGSGEAGICAFGGENPDLVLLDIILPDIDGYTVCQRIRELSRVPIIMITALNTTDEKIRGFNAGADDFVTKPFSYGELVARVKAVLRRTNSWDEPPDKPAFRSFDLVVDFTAHSATLRGQRVDLTATEYRLLSCLAQNADRVLTPDQILGKVWGEEYTGETHLLQVNIGRLRNKLGDNASNPGYIETKSGIGYMLRTSNAGGGVAE